MIRKYTPHFILVASIILLVLNIYRTFFNDDKIGGYLGIIANLLLIASAIAALIDRKKKQKP